MGGRGSGRGWRWDARDTVDDMRALDVRRLKREGLLEPGNKFGWRWANSRGESSIKLRVEASGIWLSYRVRDTGAEEWKDMNYNVPLVSTPCHLGGSRAWFLCPARGCGRRVAKLYSGRVFACRKCHQLAYPSQREPAYERHARRADKIREKLGWRPGILNGPEHTKPKGMHWKTYDRLVHEYRLLEQASLRGICESLGAFVPLERHD